MQRRGTPETETTMSINITLTSDGLAAIRSAVSYLLANRDDAEETFGGSGLLTSEDALEALHTRLRELVPA